jgi:hypothetical protein
VHAQKRADDGEITHDVNIETTVDADATDEQPNETRTQKPSTIPNDSVQSQRIDQVLALH